MARLIDADALPRLGQRGGLVPWKDIKDAPTVDAIEVVKDMFRGEMKLMPLEDFPRDQDKTCEFCYYQYFDERTYPCSRCVCNMPTENKFAPMIRNRNGEGREWR